MELTEFLGWKGSYALFKIKRGVLPNGNSFEELLVAHEGNWTTRIGYPEYEHYEDVQKDLGKGLTFETKEYSELHKRSFFLYSFDWSGYGEYILAVPATGEEIYFEIYGVDSYGALVLLVEREL